MEEELELKFDQLSISACSQAPKTPIIAEPEEITFDWRRTVSDEPTVSRIPMSILDDIDEFFNEELVENSELYLVVDVRKDFINIYETVHVHSSVIFSRKSKGVCSVTRISGRNIETEEHRNDFIELAVSTVMRIMRSSKWSSRYLTVVYKNGTDCLEEGKPTFLKFTNLFHPLRYVLDTFNRDTLHLLFTFNNLADYVTFKSMVKCSIIVMLNKGYVIWVISLPIFLFNSNLIYPNS